MLLQQFGRLLIPAVESRFIVFANVTHQHHSLCCCRRIAASSSASHRHYSSRSFDTCLFNSASQHRPSAVCTVTNDCHHLLTPATVYLSRVSFRSLPKYESEQHMQDRHAAMAAHDRDSKPFPAKEPIKDDNKTFTSYKKDINISDKTQPSQRSDTSQASDSVSPESQPGDVVTEEKKGIFARFKMAYKQYGKVLIGVHLATSTVWFSSFYYAAVTGIDVIPLLQSMGVGETVLKAFSNPAIGDVAVAYLLYKIATPARYAVTIGGTHWTVRQLRRLGYMPPVPQGDSIRSLMKEGRSQMKEKASTMKDRAEDVRDKIKEKTKDHVDSMRDNMQKKKQK